MQWSVEPYSEDETSITMTAVDANDLLWGLPVEYYFICETGDCHDSGWQSDPDYTDMGLQTGAEYGYSVKARDIAGNETEPSPVRYAIAGGGGGVPGDTTAPTPNPMQFAVNPFAVSSTSVSMEAVVASDASTPVQYYFDETSGNPGGNDSGWIGTTIYTDSGLDPNTQYCYRVRARDARGNVGNYSGIFCATTPGSGQQPDVNAPSIDANALFVHSDDVNNISDPCDNTWSAQWWLYANGPWWHKIVADVSSVTDDSAGPLEVRFVCLSDNAFSSQVRIPAAVRPILIGNAGQFGSIAEGYFLTYNGNIIAYDVDVSKFGGVGRDLEWMICIYDPSLNESCSVVHLIGPPPLSSP
jgi:hypothetical protein